LSHLAAALLRDAGHNPTSDTMRRIGTTLEAMSAYTSPDTATPGRLTGDLDPPGYDLLAALIPDAATSDRTRKPASVSPFQKAGGRANSAKETAVSDIEIDQARATIAAAKISRQNAERVLGEARLRAQAAEAALKRANADAN